MEGDFERRLRDDSIQSLIDAAERDGIRLSELCLRDQAEELERPEEKLSSILA